jgi:hypothetical protein
MQGQPKSTLPGLPIAIRNRFAISGPSRKIWTLLHKLARIIYPMVTARQGYNDTICAQNEAQNRQRLEAQLRKQAGDLGLETIPAKTGATS